MNFAHVSVLLNEVVEQLKIKKDGVYLDGTAGGGGHSFAISQKLDGSGMLYAFDRDDEAIEAATNKLKGLNAKVIKANYREAAGILKREGVNSIDGALLDLGVSSHQLNTAQRGFSYRMEGELDMRMGDDAISAAELVNNLSKEELQKILFRYADEKNAGFISAKIVKEREIEPITTTTRLAEVVTSALPPKVRRKDKNPAKKTFQALRIAANDELGALENGLESIFNLLATGGRFCVITFHSIEDRMVKNYFKQLCEGCICPKELPKCVCGNEPKARLVVKFILPSDAELSVNRRAASAKLRVIEKL